MPRLMLSDEHWSKLRAIMQQHGIYHKPGLRKMVEGMLHRMRVGCPWRDLPPKFGRWNSIFQKFNRWSSNDKLMKIFKSLVRDPDLEWEFLDGSYVRAHQHSAGAAGGEDQAIGHGVRLHVVAHVNSSLRSNLLLRPGKWQKNQSAIAGEAGRGKENASTTRPTAQKEQH